MKAIALIIALLFLTPSALALQVITPAAPNYTGQQVFQNKNAETYSMSLTNPPFNYSAAYGANDSINAWSLKATMAGAGVSSTTNYDIIFTFNASDTWDFAFVFYKAGVGSLAIWSQTVSLFHNGQFLCNSASGIFPQSLTSEIAASGNVAFFAPTATIGMAPLAGGNSNLTTGNNNLSNVVLWTAGVGSSNLDCLSNGFSWLQEPTVQLTAPLSVSLTTTDPQVYTHTISWSFLNASSSQSFYLAVGNATGQAQASQCATSNLFGSLFNLITSPSVYGLFCVIGSSVAFIGQFVYGLVTATLSIIFQGIPGGQTFVNVVTMPLQLIMQLTVSIAQIYFGAGSNYPPGGSYFALFVWSACIGLSLAGITGRFEIAWRFPVAFVKVTTIGAIIFFYYIYVKLPTMVYDFIFRSIEAVPGE